MSVAVSGDERAPLAPKIPERKLEDLGLEDLEKKRRSIISSNRIVSGSLSLVGGFFLILAIASNDSDNGGAGLICSICGLVFFSISINNYTKTIKKIKEIGARMSYLERSGINQV